MSGVAGGDSQRAMAERTTILRVPAGSNLHKHVRPKNVAVKVGDPFQCPFCEKNAAGETQP